MTPRISPSRASSDRSRRAAGPCKGTAIRGNASRPRGEETPDRTEKERAKSEGKQIGPKNLNPHGARSHILAAVRLPGQAAPGAKKLTHDEDRQHGEAEHEE